MKGCHECKHLSYWCGEPGEQNGFMCEKRDPKTAAEESKFLRNLDTDAYRNRYKRCFEPVGTERKAP